MYRPFSLALTIVVIAAISPRNADAARISPRNPYRSFNISGVNYGSMRWEQTHRRYSPTWSRGGGWLLRRK